jgi:integrase/recombinase XerC
MASLPSSTALVPYLGHGEEGATAWVHLARSDRRRTAMGAADEHDAATLWSLTEAWLRTFSKANTSVAPSTIQARVAAGRGLHAALRWCRATSAEPFADCRVPVDPTPAWDKRLPYGDDEIAALLQAAAPVDQVLVLLGKGGRQRIVALSATLRQALATWPRRADGEVLPYRTAASAWRHMQELCQTADVAPKGVHALRHSAGTRLYAETHDLEATARHLGHTKVETTHIYAKWSDRHLRETIGRW